MTKIKANSTESRTLATLRDTLLPKLLSGELSVAEFRTEHPMPYNPHALSNCCGSARKTRRQLS